MLKLARAAQTTQSLLKKYSLDSFVSAGVTPDSITRGVYSSGSPTTNVIQYITIATLGNATDFGDTLSVVYQTSGNIQG